MDAWIWWVIAAGVLGVLEIVSGGALILGMLAAAALVGGIVAGVGGPPALAFGAFAISAIGLIGVVRPVARRHLRMRPEVRTGVAALIGAEAVVLEPVDGSDGRIRLAGEIWSARAYDGSSSFPAGATVQVLSIEGATALVAA